jgi:hypothetical protein
MWRSWRQTGETTSGGGDWGGAGGGESAEALTRERAVATILDLGLGHNKQMGLGLGHNKQMGLPGRVCFVFAS